MGIGGQVDEVFRIIYPRVLVSFAEATNLPSSSPSPRQLWACKAQIQGGEEKMRVYGRKAGVFLMKSQISSPLSVLYLRLLSMVIEEDAPSCMF